MKISVSSYSFAQYHRAGKLDYITTMEKAHEMGFEAIEYIDLPGGSHEKECELAAVLRARADELGMDINAHTVSANLYQGSEEADKYEVERIKRKLDVAAILGAKVLRHDACWNIPKTGNVRSFDAMLPTIAKNAREITEYAATLGIKTCVENHGKLCQDPDRVERLFNAVESDNFGLLCDMGNFLCADADPILSVAVAAPYAFHVHAKDFLFKPGELDCPDGFFTTLGGNHIRGTILGHGVVPIRSCITALKRVGYDAYVSLEFEGMEECIPAVTAGFEFLKKTI